MRIPVQEKIQITSPPNNRGEDPGPWQSFESARQSQADVPSFDAAYSADPDGNKFNKMPPGMDIGNQNSAEINNMPFVIASENDVSKDTNPAAFAQGFKRHELSGTDDQYTDEHVDHFYGDAGGFVERNNYLDRI